MSRYLSLARSDVDTNEEAEKSANAGRSTAVIAYEINEENEKCPSAVSRAEVVALGLSPDLIWMRVSREEVAASTPPAGWNGTLPDNCAWRTLCEMLGPCPRHQADGLCRTKGVTP
jgi:hypothetical protein